MKKQYRIKRSFGRIRTESRHIYCPKFAVQFRSRPGWWITIKRFVDPYDPGYARLEAEELLEKLQ